MYIYFMSNKIVDYFNQISINYILLMSYSAPVICVVEDSTTSDRDKAKSGWDKVSSTSDGD